MTAAVAGCSWPSSTPASVSATRPALVALLCSVKPHARQHAWLKQHIIGLILLHSYLVCFLRFFFSANAFHSFCVDGSKQYTNNIRGNVCSALPLALISLHNYNIFLYFFLSLFIYNKQNSYNTDMIYSHTQQNKTK